MHGGEVPFGTPEWRDRAVPDLATVARANWRRTRQAVPSDYGLEMQPILITFPP